MTLNKPLPEDPRNRLGPELKGKVGLLSEQDHTLVDYYYEPEVAAYVQYVTPVDGEKESMESIDPELASNPLIFPDAEMSAMAFDMPAMTAEEDNRYTQAYRKALGN